MKPFLLIILFLSSFMQAQKSDQKSRYKEVAGRYGSSDGICLFDDGTYMLYGYATVLFGTYNFEKDYINFYPDKQDLFMIFGTHNPTIGNTSRIYFSGFEGGGLYIRFDQAKPQPVFNENANCFAAPYVFESKTKPSQIILSTLVKETWKHSRFTLPKDYNDLAIVFNRPIEYEDNFSGTIKSEGKTKVLTISMFERGLKKSSEDQNSTNWREIQQMKSEYHLSKEAGKSGIFFNQHYNNFQITDQSAYTYNSKTNQYIVKNPGDNEDYFRGNQYNDNRFLRRYLKVEGQTETGPGLDKNSISSKSIFFTSCEDSSQKSYKYDGLTEEENKDEPQRMQETTAVVPAPPQP